jgi:hypothetical protein
VVHSTVLPKPITTDDGTFTSTVSEMDWSGGSIPVGQFSEFNVLAQGLPTGTALLTFKAVQLYSDTVVSWIQVPTKAAPNPAHPAPTLVLTAPGKGSSGSAPGSGPAATPSVSMGAPTGTISSSDNGLAVASIILSAFALAVAGLAIWLGRPRLPPPE